MKGVVNFWDKIFIICLILCYIAIIGFVIMFLLNLFKTIQDNKCYNMSDNTFYATKECEPYWNYRKEEYKNE